MFLKKKVQAMLTETYRVVLQDWKCPTPQLHERLDFLSVGGWIQYLDYFVAKKMMDFGKPKDMAYKLGSQRLEVWQQLRQEAAQEIQRKDQLDAALHGVPGVITRARIIGQLRYSKDNSSTYHPRTRSFIPRALRTFNKVNPVYNQTNLATAKWYQKQEMKVQVRYHCRTAQEYF